MRDQEAARVVFFNDTATTEIYTLSLHDALPICGSGTASDYHAGIWWKNASGLVDCKIDHCTFINGSRGISGVRTRSESTRLNSSHANISYAVFCLKKKKYPCSDSILSLHAVHSL